MRLVEDQHRSQRPGRQRHFVVSLRLILLEHWKIGHRHVLRFLIKVAVHDFDGPQLLVEKSFIHFLYVGKLLARGIDLEVVGIDLVDATLRIDIDHQMAFQRRHLDSFGRGDDGVLPLVPIGPETRHPVIVAGRLRFLVSVGVVFDMHRREEVHVGVGGEVGADAAQVLQHRRIGLVEAQHDRGLVDLLGPHADRPRERRLLVNVLVVDDVIGPEGHIIRCERLAIGPLVALAQIEGDFSVIVVPLPALGHVGHHGRHVVRVADHVELTPGKDFRSAGLVGARKAAQRPAVFATVDVRQHHERLFRQPLLDRRKRSGRDLAGEIRTLRKSERRAGLLFQVHQLHLMREFHLQARRFGDRRAACRARRWQWIGEDEGGGRH